MNDGSVSTTIGCVICGVTVWIVFGMFVADRWEDIILWPLLMVVGLYSRIIEIFKERK